MPWPARAGWGVVSGLLMRLAFPPFDLTGAAWIAAVPWFLSLRGVSPPVAAGLGAVMGSALSISLGAWVPGVMLGGFKATAVGAYGLGLGLALSYVPAVVVVSCLLGAVRLSSPLFAPAAGVAWALAELSFDRLWPTVPWVVVGATQVDTLIASAASMLGVYGVSSLVIGGNDLADRLSELAREVGAPIVLGGSRAVGSGRRNSAFVVRSGARPEAIYDKLRLLPIAEYKPIWLPGRLQRWLGRFAPTMSVSFGSPISAQLADLGQPDIRICFEGAMSRAPRDPHAGFILNLVNDGWFGGTPAAAHHLLLARWRAIESGALLVRASTIGISAITSASGEIVEDLAAASPAVLLATVAISQTETAFEAWGYAPLGASAVLLALELARRYRSSSGSWSKEPEITA